MTDNDFLKATQKIAISITHGDLSKVDLTCPRCGNSSLIFSFTVNRPPKYGLYIHCKNCGLLHHFTLGVKPPNFQEKLILPYYQELENQAMRFTDDLSDKDIMY